MASGPHWDQRRGTYRVQWFDGYRWRRPTVYRVPGWKPGQPKPKKVPPEAQAAVKDFADKERAARVNPGHDPSVTVADFLASYRGAYANEREPGSVEQLDHAIRVFQEWCAAVKVAKLDEVTTAACQRFLDWRSAQISRKTKKPLSPVRVNQERALLSGAWGRSFRLGEIGANPWKPSAAPGWDKHRKRKRDLPHWTPEQFASLVAHARPWLRNLLTFGTQTGLRIEALTGIEWRDIRWAKDGKGLGTIVVRPELDKAGRGYEVPMSATAHDLLSRLEIHRDDRLPNVLRAARGGTLQVWVTHKAIQRACRKAGLAIPASPNHHMRRTFGRWAVLGQLTGRPIPMYVVMRWMGHSTIDTTMRYLAMAEADNQDWMAAAPQP